MFDDQKAGEPVQEIKTFAQNENQLDYQKVKLETEDYAAILLEMEDGIAVILPFPRSVLVIKMISL